MVTMIKLIEWAHDFAGLRQPHDQDAGTLQMYNNTDSVLNLSVLIGFRSGIRHFKSAGVEELLAHEGCEHLSYVLQFLRTRFVSIKCYWGVNWYIKEPQIRTAVVTALVTAPNTDTWRRKYLKYPNMILKISGWHWSSAYWFLLPSTLNINATI